MRSTSSSTMSRLNARSSSKTTISAVLMSVVVRWPALRTSRRPPASLVRLCGGRGRSQGSDTTGSRQARAQARMRADMARFNASSGSKNRTDRPAAKCPRAATISVAVLPDWTDPRMVTCSRAGSSQAPRTSIHGAPPGFHGLPLRGPSATTTFFSAHRRSRLTPRSATIGPPRRRQPHASRVLPWRRRRPDGRQGRCPEGPPPG